MLALTEAVRSGDVFDFHARDSRDAVIASAEDKLQPSDYESIVRRPVTDERGDEEGALFSDSSPSVDGNHHQETTAAGRSHHAAGKDGAERCANSSGDATATTTSSSSTTRIGSALKFNNATVVCNAATASPFPVATAIGEFFECCGTRGTVRMRRMPAAGRDPTAADGSRLTRQQKQSKKNMTTPKNDKSNNLEMIELLHDRRRRPPAESDVEQFEVDGDHRRRAAAAAAAAAPNRDIDCRSDGEEGRLSSAGSGNCRRAEPFRLIDGSVTTAACDDRRIDIRKYASRFQSRHRQRLLQRQQQQQKLRDHRSSSGEAQTARKSDVRLVIVEGGEHVRAELVRRRRSGVSDYNEVENGDDDDEQQLVVVVTPRAHLSPTVSNGSPVHHDVNTSDLGGVSIVSNRKDTHDVEWGRGAALSSGDEATPDGWSPASSCRHPKTDDSPASGSELVRRAGDTSGFRRLLGSTGSRGSGYSEVSNTTAQSHRTFGGDGVMDTTSQRYQDGERSPEADTSPSTRDDVVKRRQQTRFCGQRLWSSRRRQRESRADDSITSRQVAYIGKFK
jgi:hypothetical protein